VVLLLATLLVVLGGASFAHRITAVEPLIGVEWARSSDGAVALEVAPGTPAARAGLEAGDILLEIQGRDVAHVLEAEELGWHAGEAGSVAVTIRRGVTEQVLQLRPDWTPRTEPYVYLVIVGLAFLLSGAFIAIRWPGIRGGLIYATLAACVYVHLTLSPTGRADTLDWAIGWSSDVAGALWPALLLHLGVALTKRTLHWRRLVLTGAYSVSLGLVGCALWISPAVFGGAYRWIDPQAAIEVWVDRPTYLWMSVAAALTIAILAKSYVRSPSSMHRSQMRWLLWGLTVGFGPFVMLYAVPWRSEHRSCPSGPGSWPSCRCCWCRQRSRRPWPGTGCTIWTCWSCEVSPRLPPSSSPARCSPPSCSPCGRGSAS